MVKKTLTTIALGTCVALSSSPILAQTTLNVSTWLPPSHVQNRVVWPTWAEWVEEAKSRNDFFNIFLRIYSLAYF